ncbi:DNA glycosylase [Irpex rosettiformis]|uniref:DNA glycosylase n=1 Tax=Irpex rosettiformis TaxID=378272 RepID=A0ACB8TVX4_9APHY|nr:DNA glycosylase [Irpex rosettiformis]
MPSVKRNASPELLGRPSPYHTSVTLFEPDEGTLRRSKRVKVKQEEVTAAVEELTEAPKKRVAKGSNRTKATTSTVKVEDIELKLVKSSSRTGTPSTAKKTKPIQQSLGVPHPAPLRWKDAYDTIKRMREHIVAPVDTMGCDQAQYKESDPKNRRFATLISLMLSSQTKDEVTDAAVSKLRTAVGGTLSVQAVLDADGSAVAEAMAKVGFWRRKTQYIKQTAQKLHNEFESDVPKTVDELCSLPGVGPKMAFLCLQVAWNINVGIGVDVHVHRITNRLGWHKPPTKTPDETRLNLQSWLPKEHHAEINHMLVGFGQMICLPVGPRCSSCDLSDGLCPSAGKGASKAKLKSKKTSETAVVEDSSLSGKGGPKIEISVEEEEVKLEES